MSLLQSRAASKTGRRIVIDLQKAERSLKEGHHKEVEQLCAEVLEERPGSAHACLVMGELRLKQRRFEESMSWIQRARDIEPNNSRGLYLYGRVLDQRGDLAGAEAAFRQAVEGDPEYADAWANLGHIQLRTGRTVEAEQHFRRAIQFDREHGLANLSLGAIHYEQNRPELAVPHLQAGIQRELSNRPGQYTLAVALHELGRLDEAVTAYRRLIAAGDEDPEIFSGLAAVFEVTGEFDMAMAGYESALELQPIHPEAAAGMARIMTASGKPQEALKRLAPLVDRGDAPACLHIAQASALRGCGRPDEALLRLADLVKRPAEPAELAPAHFMLGSLLDQRADYDRAFAHFRRARQLEGSRYQPLAHEQFVTRLSRAFTREAMDTMPRGSASDVPVFIIGMPGSGSELLEQIIAAHPRGAVAGALPHVDLGAGRIGRYNNAGLSYPECINALRERDLRELSASYLSRMFTAGEQARRISDSMWLNFLHLGLVELMFPKARILHIRRAPLDIGLACYFRSFTGLSASFAGELADIGHFYGQYCRIMDHWRETTTLPMLELEYEAIVQAPESESRRVLEFLGLRWDPGCIPSQPGEPGWSQHYDQYLGPLRESLAAAGHPVD